MARIPTLGLRLSLCLVAAWALALALAVPARAEQLRLFTIGSGGLTGTYYAAARAICRESNAAGPADLRCSPEPTAGSNYNLVALEAGELDFAFVQSDWQRDAYLGMGAFSGRPMDGLRSVMSLYAESVTLVVRPEAGIERVADLAGRIVDLGARSSGRRATNERVLRALGLPSESFAAVVELSGPAVATELCAGRVDASMLVVGHPNAGLGDYLRRCDLRLVPIMGPEVEAFLSTSSDFSPYVIAAGTYLGVIGPVPTIAVTATLVTRADVSDDRVTHMTRLLLDRHAELARRGPALPVSAPAVLRQTGLSAPQHPAAAAAFEAPPGATAGN